MCESSLSRNTKSYVLTSPNNPSGPPFCFLLPSLLTLLMSRWVSIVPEHPHDVLSGVFHVNGAIGVCALKENGMFADVRCSVYLYAQRI